VKTEITPAVRNELKGKIIVEKLIMARMQMFIPAAI
jgi:hypothetical protein